MQRQRSTPTASAFTLIELMVVVSIIGLLVAVLLPAFSVVRTKARRAQATAQFQALATGLETFRGEQELGSGLPPSAGDKRGAAGDRQIIANPQTRAGENGGSAEVRVAGAHLLYQAMLGADGLGTPGFRDFGSQAARDGQWWNDTHDDTGGAYEIDPSTGQEMHVRYGGAGYVDEKMKAGARSLAELEDKGLILNLDDAPDVASDEPFFVGPWGAPILYYKANRASQLMTGSSEHSGIYWQEDNGVITGTVNGLINHTGLDFGAGTVNGQYHALVVAESPLATVPLNTIQTGTAYDNSFARFILDPTSKARPTPARKQGYLLIGAGPDLRYGTEDDVTNWTRQQD